MPSSEHTYAIVRETEDEHGGSIINIETTEEFHLQEKTVTPSLNRRVVKPDGDNGALSQVTVEPIPKAHISTLTLSDGHITGYLRKRETLTGILASSRRSLIGIIGRNTNIPYYEGPYVVDPSAHNDIILETEGLAMSSDVVVNQIYSAEVSNPAGGYTFYIANN